MMATGTGVERAPSVPPQPSIAETTFNTAFTSLSEETNRTRVAAVHPTYSVVCLDGRGGPLGSTANYLSAERMG
jgi:hypothetical protein